MSQTQEFDPQPGVTSKQTASAQLLFFLDVIIDTLTSINMLHFKKLIPRLARLPKYFSLMMLFVKINQSSVLRCGVAPLLNMSVWQRSSLCHSLWGLYEVYIRCYDGS